MKRPLVATVIGTRPEAIKMAPVHRCLQRARQEFDVVLLSTGQHREMLSQVLPVFGLAPDIDLDLMHADQTLSSFASLVMRRMEQVLSQVRPDLLLVQGDTTTVFASAVTAFNLGIPVGHVEAGLRSGDNRNPFPEEVNRRLTAVVTELHFAPTRTAAAELMSEGVAPEQIAVTGNTVIDALVQLADAPAPAADRVLDQIRNQYGAGRRLILVTSHRRETWGHELENICHALRDLVARFPDLVVLYPVHMNPNVRGTVGALLGGQERIVLTEPVDYVTFIQLMKASHLILTDSGGVQEEAPTFHKPVLVLRRTTERPEAARAGLARIIGTSRPDIVRHATRLLDDDFEYCAMSQGPNPFGDGVAAERIVEGIRRWHAGRRPLLEPSQQFNGYAGAGEPRLAAVGT